MAKVKVKVKVKEPKKVYAYCEWCIHLADQIEYGGAWKCVNCGAIRGSEPPKAGE